MAKHVSRRRQFLVFLLLRVGVAFSLLYAAYSGFVNPSAWVGYVPDLPFGIEREVALQIWGGVETVLGLWLLSGWRIFIPSLVTALAIAAVTLINLSQFSVLFRDVSIALASAALALWSWPGVGIMGKTKQAGE